MGSSFHCGVVRVGTFVRMQKVQQVVGIRSSSSFVRSRVSTQKMVERVIRGVVVREIDGKSQKEGSKTRQ